MTELNVPSQEDVMATAAEQERQPVCIHCMHPLDKVVQAQTIFVVWEWNEKTKSYNKCNGNYDGDADKPEHICSKCQGKCNAQDWEFLDGDLID